MPMPSSWIGFDLAASASIFMLPPPLIRIRRKCQQARVLARRADREAVKILNLRFLWLQTQKI